VKRRRKDSRRKEQRERRKERKEAEKERKREELRRLQNLKKEEIRKKLLEIEKISGVRGTALAAVSQWRNAKATHAAAPQWHVALWHAGSRGL